MIPLPSPNILELWIAHRTNLALMFEDQPKLQREGAEDFFARHCPGWKILPRTLVEQILRLFRDTASKLKTPRHFIVYDPRPDQPLVFLNRSHPCLLPLDAIQP